MMRSCRAPTPEQNYSVTWISASEGARRRSTHSPQNNPNTSARSPGEVPFGELLLYTMRHVQEHAAQLHLFLGQQRGKFKA